MAILDLPHSPLPLTADILCLWQWRLSFYCLVVAYGLCEPLARPLISLDIVCALSAILAVHTALKLALVFGAAMQIMCNGGSRRFFSAIWGDVAVGFPSLSLLISLVGVLMVSLFSCLSFPSVRPLPNISAGVQVGPKSSSRILTLWLLWRVEGFLMSHGLI